MIDSNETTAYQDGRDAGYAEGYEDGLKNRNGFTEEDFSENELRMLKLAFALVDCDTETRRESRYDNDEVNAVYTLKEKLKIDGIV